MSWFAGSVMRGGHLVTGMQSARDPDGFARLRELCDRDPHVSPEARAHVLHRGAVIVGAKGGLLRQITVGDVIELLDAEASAHAKPMATRVRVLPDSPPDGDLRGRGTADAAGADRLAPAHARRADRPLRPGLPASPRPAGGLPEGAAARAGLQQPAEAFRGPGRRVLERPRAPSPRHQQPAPARAGIRSLEAAPAVQAEDHRDRHGREGCRHRRADQLPPVPDPGAGLLPGPGAVGHRGARPVGRLGRSLPRRRGGNQPAQGRPAPQVTDGRPHPGTASRPARPGPGHRRAAQERGGTAPGRPPGAPGRDLHDRGADPDPVRDHAPGQREDLGG